MDELYREEILEHYKHPQHKRPLDDPTLSAEAKNPMCGDEIRFELKVVGDVVTEVGWTGSGCAISQASASMLADELIGLTQAQVAEYDKDQLLELMGVTFSPVRLKCALLSWSVASYAAGDHGGAFAVDDQ